MSRDYKSRRGTSSKGGGSLILGIFIGYALGLISAIGVWLYINQAPSPFLTEDKTASRPKEELLSKPTQTEKSAVNSSNVIEESKSRFDFYKILPGIDEPNAGSLSNSKEVAQIIETDLNWLQNPANLQKKQMYRSSKDTAIEVPFYNLHGHTLWGATALMTAELLYLLR